MGTTQTQMSPKPYEFHGWARELANKRLTGVHEIARFAGVSASEVVRWCFGATSPNWRVRAQVMEFCKKSLKQH